jgi:uncharacterized protein YcbX
MPSDQLLEIRRYPVKSMLGETPRSAAVGATGLAGDRAHALLDGESGKLASAKDPRRWAGLLAIQAAYMGEAAAGAPLVLERADGARIRSDEPRVNDWLAELVGRRVQLVATSEPPAKASYDDVWPDIEGLAPQPFIDATKTGVTEAGQAISTLQTGLLAPGSFQDLAPLTLMTTASLRAAAALHPASRWDPHRFRTNLLLETAGDGFLENDWVGRRIALGEVVLEVIGPTPRCVMTTLAQQDLPADQDILRTLARHNRIEFKGAGRFACRASTPPSCSRAASRSGIRSGSSEIGGGKRR